MALALDRARIMGARYPYYLLAIRVLDSIDEERKAVSTWLSNRSSEGVVSHEIGIFVRSPAELERARAAVEDAGLQHKVLDENVQTTSGHVSISTMHLAEGAGVPCRRRDGL